MLVRKLKNMCMYKYNIYLEYSFYTALLRFFSCNSSVNPFRSFQQLTQLPGFSDPGDHHLPLKLHEEIKKHDPKKLPKNMGS